MFNYFVYLLNKIAIMRKAQLPTKICKVCERTFTWRKKWERVWDEVHYCSERCRRNKKQKKWLKQG